MEIDDLFAGGGAPVAKFPTIGTTHLGTITHLEARQQRDFDKGEPLTWDDGSPRMELVITIDNAGEVNRLFVKGAMLSALRDEIRRLGLKKPEIGGKLAVKYSHDGENKNPKLNPPKMYQVAYEPPAAAAVEELIAAKPNKSKPTDTAENLDPQALAALLGSQ
jgi:hypothetical protein